MADALQSVLIELRLAITPFQAVKTPDQAVSFFRQLGCELPLSPAGLDPRQDDAVRCWIRAPWQGRVPDDPIGINATFQSNFHTSSVVEHHETGLATQPSAVSPMRQRHAHIVTRAA